MNKSIAVIVSVGSGLGLALAKKFISKDCNVIMISRNIEHLISLLSKIDGTRERVAALPADVTQEDEIKSVFNRIKKEYGHPEILIYNAASKFESKGICDISPEDFIASWKVNCYGGLLTAQQVIPSMLQNKKGTILFTGATASIRGSANLASFAVGKCSQRALRSRWPGNFPPMGYMWLM